MQVVDTTLIPPKFTVARTMLDSYTRHVDKIKIDLYNGIYCVHFFCCFVITVFRFDQLRESIQVWYSSIQYPVSISLASCT
jgi:hypothetical protein